ncbi:MAG: S8 family serine peptidase, partial [Deltaproteobacteria bacterium]|nr:S8 family serine peptidase [Deltaproteobacteria bacterium]
MGTRRSAILTAWLAWLLTGGCGPSERDALSEWTGGLEEEAPALEIRLLRARFDPLGKAAERAWQRGPDGADRARSYLVQLAGPVRAEWLAALRGMGAEVFGYVPEYAFVVWMDRPCAERVAGQAFVRWVGDHEPAWRVHPDLDLARGQLRLQASFLPLMDEMLLRAEIEALGGRVESVRRDELDCSLQIALSAERLGELARMRGLSWVEPLRRPVLVNDVARSAGLMAVEPVWQDLGLYGEGQIVAVCDTGLDRGVNNASMNDDFEGRIVAIHDLSGTGADDVCSGHGSHVAGSVLGNGVNSGSDPAGHDYAGSFAGIAPEARLVFQAFEQPIVPPDNCLVNIGAYDMGSVFQQAYDDGARIHTNSWGYEGDGAYTTQSRQVDSYLWSHPEFTVLFGAGNAGADANSNGVVDLDSLMAPCTAKNCICVGGTENDRPQPDPNPHSGTYNQIFPGVFTAAPIRDDYSADDPGGLAAFSSRGPCDDGRVKPDLVAPATWVLSVYSQANHPDDGGNQYAGWGQPRNRYYKYLGGTSMSTPLTAGAAALVREYYNDIEGLASPSGALIKATLVNGAADLDPGQYGTGAYREIHGRPDWGQGFGRVDLARSLLVQSPRVRWFEEHGAGLSTGEDATYSSTGATPLELVDASEPVRVTLVWNDYPGTLASGGALVNDLDLEVIDPLGGHFYGNGSAWDRTNNVEDVEIASPELGSYTVVVRAFSVAHGPQPFALVVSGAFSSVVTCYLDGDRDGHGRDETVVAGDGRCDTADGEAYSNGDCDDADPDVHPGADEVPDDGVDQDCNGSDTITCILDADHDGYGTDAGTTVLAPDGSCDADDGESLVDTDCDDLHADAHPGGVEVPDDGIDQDCSGSDTVTCVIDADHDGYGTDAGTTVLADDGSCDQAQGEADDETDCDDDDSGVHPGVSEVPDDGIDQDCNGFDTVTCVIDADHDG